MEGIFEETRRLDPDALTEDPRVALGYELRITDVLVLVVVLVLVGLVILRVKREEERSGASKQMVKV